MKTIGKIIWFISSGLAYFFYKNDAYCTSQYIIAPTYNSDSDTTDIHVETYATNPTKCNGNTSDRCTFNPSRTGAPETSPNGCGKNMYFFSCGTYAPGNASCPGTATCKACPNNGKTLQSGFVTVNSIARSTCCHHFPNGKKIKDIGTSYIITYTVRARHTINSIGDCYTQKDITHTETPGHTYKFNQNCYYK